MAGAELWPASGDNAYQVVGDVTGNGWPDIVQPANGGHWPNARGTLAWVDVPSFPGGRSLQNLFAHIEHHGDLRLFMRASPKFNTISPRQPYRTHVLDGFPDRSPG